MGEFCLKQALSSETVFQSEPCGSAEVASFSKSHTAGRVSLTLCAAGSARIPMVLLGATPHMEHMELQLSHVKYWPPSFNCSKAETEYTPPATIYLHHNVVPSTFLKVFLLASIMTLLGGSRILSCDSLYGHSMLLEHTLVNARERLNFKLSDESLNLWT